MSVDCYDKLCGLATEVQNRLDQLTLDVSNLRGVLTEIDKVLWANCPPDKAR